MSTSLYVITVLVWGTTFYAVTFQGGSVPAEQSVLYRYMIAAALMWAIALFRAPMPSFSPALHARFLALGLFMFSLNYVVVYMAVERMPSGLVSVVFSMSILLNCLQVWVLYGHKPDARLIFGSVLGITGLSLLFADELLASNVDAIFLAGLGFAVAAALSASTGNIVSQSLSQHGVDVAHANTWSMTYGVLLTASYVLWTGHPLQFETTAAYVGSLVYLAVFGSVLAFYTYLTLIARIGAPRAAYCSVLFSLVALVLSTLFESMHWNMLMLLGVAMILVGNIFIIPKSDKSAEKTA